MVYVYQVEACIGGQNGSGLIPRPREGGEASGTTALFIGLNRAHQKISERAGNLIFRP